MNEVTEIKKENSELGKGEFYDLMRFIESIDNNMEQLWDHCDPDTCIKDELQKLEPNYYDIESFSYQAQLMKNITDDMKTIREVLEISYATWVKKDVSYRSLV